MIYRKFYSFWDIPRTMLYTVKVLVKKNEPCVVRLINAQTIEKELESIIEGSKVVLVLEEIPT